MFRHYRLKIKRENKKKYLIGKTFTLTKQNTNTLNSDKRAVGFKSQTTNEPIFVFPEGTEVINQPDRLLEKYLCIPL